jgi:hypothetical protein
MGPPRSFILPLCISNLYDLVQSLQAHETLYNPYASQFPSAQETLDPFHHTLPIPTCLIME